MPNRVSKIFNSKTIAIVGATDKSHWPRNIFTNLTKSGFPGKIFPVNPKRDKIFEVPCYPDLSSLPVPADLALMIIPAPAIEDALRQGLKNGLKAAIVYASGFGDGGHKQSIKRGEAFREALKEIDIPICGPNCMGLAGIRQKLYCYPHEHVRNMEPGTVALITQSGGTLSYFTRTGQERGLRFSYAISSGNEISLDLADYMDFVIDDPNTKQICLFIEGIRKPDSFKRAAAKALKVGKPIIAIKTGKSMKSREAAQSHSGAVAGDYLSWVAVRAAAAKLLLDRSLQRADQLRVHAADLCRAVHARQLRHHRPDRHDGGLYHAGFGGDRVPHRLLRRALCEGPVAGGVLPWDHDAAVVELSR